MNHAEATSKRMKPLLVGLCAAAALVLIGGGILFYNQESHTLRRQRHAELQAIADLKIGQITAWREEILSDVRLNAAAPFVRRTLARILSAPDDPAARADLTARLVLIKETEEYQNVMLATPDGRLLISLDPGVSRLDDESGRLALQALTVRAAVLGEITRLSPPDPIHIDAAAPILDDSRRPLAVLILRSDPRVYLFPLIQNWPTPSPSAETLLVRRDREEVLFLNGLRHQADAALNLRIPISQKTLPAAQALQGRIGLSEGLDYRGVAVLADLRPVPDSDWFVVAKVDQRELNAELRFRGGAILALVLMGVILTSLTAALVYRQRRQDLYRELFDAERRRREAQEEIRATFYGIGDGVIATDARGCVTRMNPVAEKLTGWPEAQAVGQPLETVFPIINENSRETVENPVARVLRKGNIVGLANHSLLIARDGREYPIADSGAPIHDGGGRIVGVVLVFRDQTMERAAEAALRASEQRYRQLFETNPQPMWVYDLDTLEIIAVNAAAIVNYGYSRDEFLNMTIADIRPAEEIQRLKQNVSQVTSGLDRAGIWRHIKKNRDEIEVEITSHTMLFEGRHAEIVMAVDVTDRRHAETALRASEENYRQLFEAESDAIFLIDNGTGRILQANSAAATLYGYHRDELLAMTNTDLSAEQQQTRQVTTQTEPLIDQVVTIPLRWHRKKDGTVFPVEITGRFFMRADRSVHIAAIRDISQRVASEAALRESEERLRLALSAANQGLFDLNLQTGEATVSDEYARMLGYEPAEFKETIDSWLSRLHPADREIAELAHRQYIAGEIPEYRIEFRMRTQDGQWKWILSQGRIMQRDAQGRPIRKLGTHTDITERKRIEEQLLQAQKMESVGRLAGGIAHDFNNMLGVIIGHSELALDQVDPGQPLHTDLQEIRKAAQRSADLTRQLLAFARKQTITPKVLDLNQTVTGMLTMLRRLIGEDIELVWKPGQELWPVRLDPAQIDQVLANLTVNARDAIAGVGTVTIETANAVLDEHYCNAHVGSREGEYVRVTVRDTGCGMAMEIQQHLFEPFFTTKDVGKGTGLGLATVYGIVKQNDGFIQVDSTPGKGTTFTIFLPRAAAAVPEADRTTRRQRLQGTETILLVEDERSVLSLGCDILQRYGYTVMAARTPHEAVELAKAHKGPLHLLLTDVVMPQMNGQELHCQIIALFPDIKTLFMSGYTAEMIGRHGMLDSGVQFLQKPFSVESLAKTVRSVLDRT